MSACPPYKLVTGITPAEGDLVSTALVVVADVVDDFGCVTDSAGLKAIREKIRTKDLRDTYVPRTVVFVRGAV